MWQTSHDAVGQRGQRPMKSDLPPRGTSRNRIASHGGKSDFRRPLALAFAIVCLAACALPVAPTITPPAPLTPSAAFTPSRPPAVTPSPPPPSPVAARALTATHHAGQTFLTWAEHADLRGEAYRIYRSSTPVTPHSLSRAIALYEVREDSARFYANRYNVDLSGEWRDRYTARLVTANHADPLPAGAGLLVWTLAPEDFAGASSGVGYYAVAVVPAGGAPVLDPRYTAGPVEESVADPRPVEIAAHVERGAHVYIQYMDLRRWNPTFHAPNALNDYYGLGPAPHAIAYAYDYVVAEPAPRNCGGTVPASVPAVVNLHGWSANTYPPYAGGYAPYWCAYMLFPIDQGETWFFGFAREHDYRAGGIPTPGNTIANYTEQRILRMLYDLMRDPPGPQVDPQRVYVYGGSMGGSGALAFALRYPQVFAAAYASEPMTDYATSGDGGGADWRNDVVPKWGRIAANLPVAIDAPNGWAAALQAYNGTGVWDWQDHQRNLRDRVADDMVPFGIAHGLADTTIEWPTQGAPVYAALLDARRAYGGAVTNDDHTWLSFQGLPPSLGLTPSLVPFAGLRVVRDESVPGLGNSSADIGLAPGMPRGYNVTVRWSSSWDPWDGPPVDTPERWQVSLCAVSPATGAEAGACGTGIAQTVDVTPRRLQRFVIVPGATYAWENRRVADGALMARGSVVAGADGLLTVEGVAVSPEGNRLGLGRSAP